MVDETTHAKRSEAGRKGAAALQQKHAREGLTEAERIQRSAAGRAGGEARGNRHPMPAPTT